MRIGRAARAAVAVTLLATQGAVAESVLPDAFQGWFAPAPQTCATAVMIGVAPARIVTAGDTQRVTGVEWTSRFPRLARVSLETVGGTGTEDLVIELLQDGQDLRVWFGDGTWTIWRRCL